MPVKPALDLRTRRGLRRIERVRSVFRREKAEDGVAFPHHRAAVLDHRNGFVGVERQELRRVQSAKGATDVLSVKLQSYFFTEPENLLDIR